MLRLPAQRRQSCRKYLLYNKKKRKLFSTLKNPYYSDNNEWTLKSFSYQQEVVSYYRIVTNLFNLQTLIVGSYLTSRFLGTLIVCIQKCLNFKRDKQLTLLLEMSFPHWNLLWISNEMTDFIQERPENALLPH